MAERSRFRPKTARTSTSKTTRLARRKAKDAPEPEKPSAKIGRGKAVSRASARRGDRKGSPEAQASDALPLGAQGSGADARAAPNGQEAQEAGANQSTEMPAPAGSIDAGPGPEAGRDEAASGDEPEGTPALQSQDAAPAKADLDAMDTETPLPPGAEGGTDRPIADRSRRRRRASAREASDADAEAASKKRARAKRSDRGVEAGTAAGSSWSGTDERGRRRCHGSDEKALATRNRRSGQAKRQPIRERLRRGAVRLYPRSWTGSEESPKKSPKRRLPLGHRGRPGARRAT